LLQTLRLLPPSFSSSLSVVTPAFRFIQLDSHTRVQSDLLTDDDEAEAQIPLSDPCNHVGHVQDDVDEPLEDDDRLYEHGSTAPMYSSPYSSFLFPLLSPVSYKLVPGFEVSSVADQLLALGKERNFRMANLQLRYTAKNMFPREAATVDETHQLFLNFYGETPGVPFAGYLGFGITRYCAC
jgi:hypothetical protein